MAGHGGARPGAGRKPKRELYAPRIEAADKFLATRLLKYYKNLDVLADGGYERVKEVWKPAGMVLIDGVVKDGDGNIVCDEKGKVTKIHVSAFPELPPDTLVLVERRIEIVDADREANQYLIDRLQGKATQAVELTGEDGGAIAVTNTIMDEAARELAEWRTKMTEQLSNMQNALPTPPTSPTNSE